jgi:hypothetical protein
MALAVLSKIEATMGLDGYCRDLLATALRALGRETEAATVRLSNMIERDPTDFIATRLLVRYNMRRLRLLAAARILART